ncbi:hypothetical protein ACF09E_34505 [Streptomyces sp. NPDC014891]|uniref:hypothetical protein n=1 Tax=Streptomyces sp. NPDC014891 TaxID=3364929 RepID=UPI0036F84127
MSQGNRRGRRMKAIAEDVGPHRRELAVALRDLIHASLPAGTPAGTLAELTNGTARSTLFHVLAGRRVPSWSTMEDLLDACATVRQIPSLLESVSRQGSGRRVTQIRASSEEHERFQRLWLNAHSEMTVERLADDPHLAADHAAALRLASPSVAPPWRTAPPGHRRTRPWGGEPETVSVPEAMEAVRLAHLRVKEATTELARAQDGLDRALARQEQAAMVDELMAFKNLREAAEVRQRITRLLVQLQSRLHDRTHPLPAKDRKTGLRIEEELREWLVRLAMADDDQDPEARRATREDVRQKLEQVRNRFSRIGISA